MTPRAHAPGRRRPQPSRVRAWSRPAALIGVLCVASTASAQNAEAQPAPQRETPQPATAQYAPVALFACRADTPPDLFAPEPTLPTARTARLDAGHVAYLRPPGWSVLRVVTSHPEQLRAFRVVRGSASGARPAIAWLEQTPAHVDGDARLFLSEERTIWRLESDTAADVEVYAVEPYVPDRAFADALIEVLAWIERGVGEVPTLPPGSGALRETLARDAALGVRAADAAPREAIVAYRRGAAIVAFLRQQPIDPRFVRVEEPRGAWRALSSAEDGPGAGLRVVRQAHAAEMTVQGPAVLALTLRAIGPGAPTLRAASVSLDDALLMRVVLPSAMAREDADALSLAPGVLDASAPADARGVSESRRVVVPAGVHRLRVTAEGGTALLGARVLEHRARFSHWLAGDENPARLFARAAAALRGTGRPSATAREFADALARSGGQRADEPAAEPDPGAHARLLAAWRRDPLSLDLRDALSRQPPVDLAWTRIADDGGTSLRVLAPTAPGAPTALTPLGPEPLALTLPPSPLDPRRPARVALWVVGRTDERATLHLDGTAYSARTTGGVDGWSLAVPPGPHTLSAEGARVMLRTEAQPRDAGGYVVRDLRVLGVGEHAEWAAAGSAVRLEVRALGGDAARLSLRWSGGAEQELRVSPAPDDAGVVGAQLRVGEPVRVVLAPPSPDARLEVLDREGRAAVALYAVPAASEPVTSDEDAALAGASTPSVPAGLLSDALLLAAVRSASDALAEGRDAGVTQPTAGGSRAQSTAYLTRAVALARLGHPERARGDLARAVTAGADAAALAPVAALLGPARSASHVALEGAVEALPLAPYELSVEGDDARLRARDAAALERAGQAVGAAQALHALATTAARDVPSRHALELASLGLFGDALLADPARAADAALLYGRARALPLSSPASRRAAVEAARLTRWQPIGPDANGGFERIELLQPDAPEGEEALSRALLGLSPGDGALLLRPGQRASLRGAPASAPIELRCVEAGDAASRESACEFEVRVGETLTSVERLRGGERRSVPSPAAGSALPLLLELTEASASAGSVGVAPGLREALRSRFDAHVASGGDEVVYHVLGPGAVELELRALGDAPAEASVTLSSSAGSERSRVELPTARAQARILPSRPGSVGAPRWVPLTLEATGSLVLTVGATRGAVLVRARLRVPRELPPTRAPEAPREPPAPLDRATSAAVAAADWEPPALGYRREPGTLGTFSLGVGALSHDVSDSDNVARPTSYVGVTGTHRLALLPGALWLRTDVELRARLTLPPALGARVRLDATDPLLGFRLGLAARVDELPAQSAFAVGGSARVDRPIDLSDALTLTPRLRLEATHQSEPTLPAGAEADFEVWNVYRRDHPVQLLPSLALRFAPAPDARLEVGAAAATNADLSSLDQVSAELSVAGIADLFAPRSLWVRLDYRPSWRFRDADRKTEYARHDLTVDLALQLVLGPAARLVLGLSGTLFLRAGATDATALVTLRVDLWDGRGLVDFSPADASFAGVLGVAGYPPSGPR